MVEKKKDSMQILLWRKHKTNSLRLMFSPTKLVKADDRLKIREPKFLIAIDSDNGTRAFQLSMDEAVLLAKIIERKIAIEQERLRSAYMKYREEYLKRQSKSKEEEVEIEVDTTSEATDTVIEEVG